MYKYILSLLFLFATSLIWSQTDQEKLGQRKAQIQQEIKEKERLLESQNRKQQSVTTVIKEQTEKIKLREKLINTTEKQSKLLKNDMYLNQLQINQLHRDLDALKTDYAAMIVKSYKSRSEQSRAMFLLSSENFLQAYKRLQYMKQYSNYRKMQGEEIKSKTIRLDDNVKRLSGQKTEKEKLIADQEKQRQDLEKEKAEREKRRDAVKSVMDAKDKNHDGSLSKDEYLTGEADAEAAGKTFDQFNKNKDRFLSKSELADSLSL